MKLSAGILMYRETSQGLEVFLGHPGGPFFKFKENGVWSIPKGMVNKDEEISTAAKREFTEETGIEIPQDTSFIYLGQVKQSVKIVHVWAMEYRNSQVPALISNPSIYGWPELDRAQFFPIEIAKQKIIPAQKAIIEKLENFHKDL